MATTVNTYDIGDRVRLSVAFTNANAVATDPTTVTVKYKSPMNATTTRIYLTDVEVVKDSDGNFHLDVTPNLPGKWFYRWDGVGAVIAAEEHYFVVRESEF